MNKSNIIYMVNLPEKHKPGRTSPYKYSVNSWKYYCDKYGFNLVTLTDRIYDESYINANWHKTFCITLLENSDIEFDNVCVVDCDTIVHPDAPNIFDYADSNICAVHNMGNYDWVIRSMENYSYELFHNKLFPLREYINTGLIVFNKSHKEFLREVHEFYFENYQRIIEIQNKYGTGTDQPVLNFLIHQFDQGLKLLPFEWNIQEMPRLEILDTDMTFTNYGYVYHFNGIPPEYKLNPDNKKSSVHQWMEYTYKNLYK